jgi:hypothetical protein
MFARFRQTDTRVQVSLVETRRIDGKVRHEHLASFGSVEMPPSVEDRIAFWQRLHQRLAKLSNRIDATAQAKILGDIHARVPMVTIDEQRSLQLRNVEADEQFWENLHDMHADTVEEHKELAASVERKIAEGQTAMTNAAAHRDTAKGRRERLQRGEDVPGNLGRPEDFKAVLIRAGFTKRDFRRMELLRRVGDFGEEVWEVFMRSTRAAEVIDRVTEREARAAIKLFSACDDPVKAAKEMLEAMGKTERSSE